MERFKAVLEEPNGPARREHIRDIYHYLMAQQILQLSKDNQTIANNVQKLANDKTNRTLNTFTSVVTGVVIGAVGIIGGFFLFKRFSSS